MGCGRPGRQEVCSFNQLDKLTNHQEFAADNTGEKDGLTNLFEIGSTKENAATSAKVNGAKNCQPLKDTLKNIMPDRESRHPIIVSHWGVAA
jgi:hypothetical protein